MLETCGGGMGAPFLHIPGTWCRMVSPAWPWWPRRGCPCRPDLRICAYPCAYSCVFVRICLRIRAYPRVYPRISICVSVRIRCVSGAYFGVCVKNVRMYPFTAVLARASGAGLCTLHVLSCASALSVRDDTPTGCHAACAPWILLSVV